MSEENKLTEPFEETLIPYIEATEQFIEQILQKARSSSGVEHLYRMEEYHLGWRAEDGTPLPPKERRYYGGKRLRPVLCLLCCQLASGEWRKALPFASAVELIHNFSLIHDDIEDGDEERRYRPTVWAIWGIPQAINTGSHMQALVHLAGLEFRSLSESVTLEGLELLTQAILRMTEGQHLDIHLQEVTRPSLEDYWRMVEGKTSALLFTACTLGALAGGVPRQEAEATYGKLGRAFGLAFQARDDFLGLWGDPSVTGKPVGSDLLRKKKTLPVVYGIVYGNEYERRRLERFFSRPSPSRWDAEELIFHLERINAKEYVQKAIEKHTQEAFQHLKALEPGPGAEENRIKAYQLIQAILEYALEREK